jgi:aspartate/methionine/tyrosine aminotransferase
VNVPGSEYLQWLKSRAPARFNLASSGAPDYPIAELGASVDAGPNSPQRLTDAIAAKSGVPPDSVVLAYGTSMANYLAMAALVQPGDEVLIEHPAYEPLVAVARYVGAEVKQFKRDPEDGFKIRPEVVEREVTNRTRLIVLTTLQNPTSALADESALRVLCGIARSAGARVLVDEVYLECLYEAFRSVFHLGDEIVATSSLTKAYGLSGLRCGWILARPELARRMSAIKDLLDPAGAGAANALSVTALRQLDRIGARARLRLDANRAALNRFLDSRDDLVVVRPQFGTSMFPRLAIGGVDRLIAILRERYDTDVVPGRFFGSPEHFRLALTAESDIFAEALTRLGAALDDLSAG